MTTPTKPTDLEIIDEMVRKKKKVKLRKRPAEKAVASPDEEDEELDVTPAVPMA